MSSNTRDFDNSEEDEIVDEKALKEKQKEKALLKHLISAISQILKEIIANDEKKNSKNKGNLFI